MSQNESAPDFFAKINKIVNYFSRTKKGGFLFCSCDNTLIIKRIVRDVIANLSVCPLFRLPAESSYPLDTGADFIYDRVIQKAGEK